jgi:hypothetical protein
LPDQAGRLEPVHLRHDYVEQDQRAIFDLDQPLQRFAPRTSEEQILSQLSQDRFVRE